MYVFLLLAFNLLKSGARLYISVEELLTSCNFFPETCKYLHTEGFYGNNVARISLPP